jgi:hypothetical protein
MQMHSKSALIAGVLFMITGCQTAAAPERRELLGSWVSNDVAGAVIRMTVAETARSVEGAGSWTEAQDADAFRVTGALARDEVALHLDFDDRTDLSFQGYFLDEDNISGTLSGGPFRQTTITFEREDLFDD